MLLNNCSKGDIFCRISEMTSLKRLDYCLPGSSAQIIMKLVHKMIVIIREELTEFLGHTDNNDGAIASSNIRSDVKKI